MSNAPQGQSQQRQGQAPNGRRNHGQPQQQPSNLPMARSGADVTMGGFLLHPDIMSNLMANAKMYADSGLVAVKNPQAAAIIILKAKALGMSADWGFANIHVINGRPCLSADGVFSLARSKAAAKFEMTESTAKVCRIKGTLPDGQTHAHTYTIEQAHQAGYTTKDNWKRMPTEMLVARCKVGLVRWLCPEVMAEMPYTREEIQDFDAIPTTGRTLTDSEAASMAAQPAATTPEVMAAETVSEPSPSEPVQVQGEATPDPATAQPENTAAPAQPTAHSPRIAELGSIVDPSKWPQGSVLNYAKQMFGTGSIDAMNEGQYRALLNVIRNSSAEVAMSEFSMMQGSRV